MLHQANGVGAGEVVLWEPGSRTRELVAVPGLEGDDGAAEEPLGVLTAGREDTRGRVLVVEDAFESLGPLARLANRLGFEVDGVGDGARRARALGGPARRHRDRVARHARDGAASRWPTASPAISRASRCCSCRPTSTMRSRTSGARARWWGS